MSAFSLHLRGYNSINAKAVVSPPLVLPFLCCFFLALGGVFAWCFLSRLPKLLGSSKPLSVVSSTVSVTTTVAAGTKPSEKHPSSTLPPSMPSGPATPRRLLRLPSWPPSWHPTWTSWAWPPSWHPKLHWDTLALPVSLSLTDATQHMRAAMAASMVRSGGGRGLGASRQAMLTAQMNGHGHGSSNGNGGSQSWGPRQSASAKVGWERPPPALYESDVPVSMAKIIISRQMQRKPPTVRPQQRRAPLPPQQRLQSMV